MAAEREYFRQLLSAFSGIARRFAACVAFLNPAVPAELIMYFLNDQSAEHASPETSAEARVSEHPEGFSGAPPTALERQLWADLEGDQLITRDPRPTPHPDTP